MTLNASNIINALNEVRDYFTSQIVFGNFKVIEIGKHVASIEIDEQLFSLWIGNGVDSLKTYPGYYNCVALEFSDETKQLIWNALRPHFAAFLATLEEGAKARLESEMSQFNHLK